MARLSAKRGSCPPPLEHAAEEHPEVHRMLVTELIAAVNGGRSDVAILDVRTDSEYAGGHIKGAKHVPGERFLDNKDTGEALAEEIICGFAASGAKTIVVLCMYSQCRGPLVADTLAAHLAHSKVDAKSMEILLLEGGFHKFLNTVRGKDGDAISDANCGLIENVKARSWVRTSTRGFVCSDQHSSLEMLTAQATADVKSLLKAHQGKLCLEDLDDLCQRASPRLCLSKEELKTLFSMAPQNASGQVDWHEFVDYLYSDAINQDAKQAN